jgi:hypothetical protein
LQLLMATQFLPSLVDDEYPLLHVHELIPGPVYPHVELPPQPPLLVLQLLMGSQVYVLSPVNVQENPLVQGFEVHLLAINQATYDYRWQTSGSHFSQEAHKHTWNEGNRVGHPLRA